MCLLGGPALLGQRGSTWLVRHKGTKILQTVGESFLSKVELGAMEEQWKEEEKHRVELEVLKEAGTEEEEL